MTDENQNRETNRVMIKGKERDKLSISKTTRGYTWEFTLHGPPEENIKKGIKIDKKLRRRLPEE